MNLSNSPFDKFMTKTNSNLKAFRSTFADSQLRSAGNLR